MLLISGNPPTLLLALVGYSLGRLAEQRIHRRNYRLLRAAGAHEVKPWLMRLYYALQTLLIVAVLSECWLRGTFASAAPNRVQVLAGLSAVALGLLLRVWAVHSLGTLWTMRCLYLPGLRHQASGPYRYLNNPEYLSRFIDGAGLCLIGGAWLTLAAHVVTSFAFSRRLWLLESETQLGFASRRESPGEA